MNKIKDTAILLIHCPDKKGIVAAVTDFLQENNGNVLHLEQHVDRQIEAFFMRIEFELEGFRIPKDKLKEYFNTLLAQKFDMKFQLHFTSIKPRMAVFVSKASHCFYDILQRYMSKEWDVEIPVIISNHANMQGIAEHFGIPFKIFPITKENKKEQEAAEIALMKELNVDFIVLARYMQIISEDMIAEYEHKIINIHHSFLPAFIGARPYHQAYERGVKIIGATSHYVTAELDAGPIIEQGVTQISHQDGVIDLKRKGKDLEKMVLSKAIFLQLQHKIMPYQNRTVIFD
ncbi:MAG: formyltetrahydrofolate deformylase [Paraglaciecola sp.]|jgi:formyltetrahydrofolate deformylase